MTRKRALGLWLLLPLAPMAANADYLAYSRYEDARAPLPERLDDIDSKYLVELEWGEFAGSPARAGVLEVDNTSTVGSYRVGDTEVEISQGGVPVNAIEAIVIDSMSRSGRFRLVERTVLKDVLSEQDLGTSGRVAQPSAAKSGKVLGAEYLVQVVVTDYEGGVAKQSAGGIGGLMSKVPLVGGLGVKSEKGRVGLNIRLIDAETSEILFTKQIESEIKSSGISLGGIGWGDDALLGGFLSNYSKTPVGQAIIAGVNQGVYDLVKYIGAKPAEGAVIKADASQVYVNLGQGIVQPGARLQIMRKGADLIDPETGISLGSSDTYLGDIVIAQVQEKFSIGRPESMTETPQRGDRVVSTVTPEPLQFASTWVEPK